MRPSEKEIESQAELYRLTRQLIPDLFQDQMRDLNRWYRSFPAPNEDREQVYPGWEKADFELLLAKIAPDTWRNPGKTPAATALAREILSLKSLDWMESKDLTIDFDMEPVPALQYIGARRDQGLGWVALLGFLWYLHLQGLTECYCTHLTGGGAHLLRKAIGAGLICEEEKGLAWDRYTVGANPKPLLDAIAL